MISQRCPSAHRERDATSVDVVILTWNDSREVLDAAISSALAQAALDLEVNVVVIDNGSTLPVDVPSHRDLDAVRSPVNLGVGGGRNFGIGHGDAPFVCVLDSDARLHEGALRALLAPMVSDDSVGLTAPVFSGQRPEASGGRAPTFTRKIARALNRTDLYRPTSRQGVGASWDVDFVIGACQVFRRSAYDAVGGIDASADFGPEDVDFCLRLRAAGWSVRQVAAAGCDHPARRAFKGLATKRGAKHALAVSRHLWRHRGSRARVAG